MSPGEKEPVFATLLDPLLVLARERLTGDSQISRCFRDRTARQLLLREVVQDIINLSVSVNMA
jgi:hypothetical protein